MSWIFPSHGLLALASLSPLCSGTKYGPFADNGRRNIAHKGNRNCAVSKQSICVKEGEVKCKDGGRGAGVTRIRLSIQPMKRSGNSISPMGHAAECCSVLSQSNSLGQRSAQPLFTSRLLQPSSSDVAG